MNKCLMMLGVASLINVAYAQESETPTQPALALSNELQNESPHVLSTAVADDDKKEMNRYYISGTLARAFGAVDANDMNNRMASLGYDANASVSGQNRTAWSANFGYRVKDYLDLELGYLDLGEVRTHLSGNVADIQHYLSSANQVHPRSVDGVDVAVRGRFYVKDTIFLYGRAGYLWGDSYYHATDNAILVTRTKKQNSMFYEIGAEYEWEPRWSIHLNAGLFDIESEKIKTIGIGISYKFGMREVDAKD